MMPALARRPAVEWGRSLGRAGRKRKQGRRQPSGKLAPVKKPDDKIRTSRQPHRRMLKGDHRLSEHAESPLGRMLLAGALNDPDAKLKPNATPAPTDKARTRFEAGELYAKVVSVYNAQLGAPRLGAMSLPVDDDALPADGEEDRPRDGGCATATADPIERQLRLGDQVITVREWPCKAMGDECACARRKARYDGAFEALGAAGRRALMVVNRVAVHREAIAPQDIVYLDRGLDALARFFGVDRVRS
jgi:hypothetical protein